MRIFLFILVYLHKFSFIHSRSDTFSLSCAKERIVKYFTESNNHFTVINLSSDSKFIDSIVIKWLKLRNVPYKVLDFTDKIDYEVDQSAILTIESENSLEIFNSKLRLTNEFPKQLKFFVLGESATVDNLSKLSNSSDIVQYQYFLTAGSDFLTLWTFVWYTPQLCNTKKLCYPIEE